MSPELKTSVLRAAREGSIKVVTDPYASPTGFPFKVLQLAGTVSSAEAFAARERVCDLGYLRQCYRADDGTVGYRCPGEPLDDYLRKGGSESDTAGRKCVCNGLVSAVGYGQVRHGGEVEPSLVTAGDDAAGIHRFLRPGRARFWANELIDRVRGVAW
jgi:nitronate monooxygenase